MRTNTPQFVHALAALSRRQKEIKHVELREMAQKFQDEYLRAQQEARFEPLPHHLPRLIRLNHAINQRYKRNWRTPS